MTCVLRTAGTSIVESAKSGDKYMFRFFFHFIFHYLFEETSPQICQDSNGQLYNVGDVWKPKPNAECSCSRGGLVHCFELIKEPGCLDSGGKVRSDKEVWMKNDCIKCTCLNDGGINCTRYQVNVTYGLFEVKTHPICGALRLPYVSRIVCSL